MSYWSRLFGKAPEPPDQLAVFIEELATLRGETLAPDTPRDHDTMMEIGGFAEIDWAAGPDYIAETLAALPGAVVSESDLNAAIETGIAAAVAGGRGGGALPTAIAIDTSLVKTGQRLIWVDTRGDCFPMAVVPDAFHARWYDVRLRKDIGLVALAVTAQNEKPRNRHLAAIPRKPN